MNLLICDNCFSRIIAIVFPGQKSMFIWVSWFIVFELFFRGIKISESIMLSPLEEKKRKDDKGKKIKGGEMLIRNESFWRSDCLTRGSKDPDDGKRRKLDFTGWARLECNYSSQIFPFCQMEFFSQIIMTKRAPDLLHAGPIRPRPLARNPFLRSDSPLFGPAIRVEIEK